MSKIFSRKNIWIILLSVLFCNVSAQELPKVLDPPVEFDKSETRKIEKSNDLINSAMELWTRIINDYNPKNITGYKTDSLYMAEGYPLLMTAAKNFQDGNMTKLEIYRKNNTAFWSKHRYDSPSGLEGAKTLQKEANTYLQKALANREAANNYARNYTKAFDHFHEAFSLEIIAVKKEGRALQLYRDWPVHYNYVYDDDIVVNLFAKEKPVEEIAAVPEKKEEVKAPQPVPAPEPEPEPYDSTVVYYQVQIVAHTVPLNSSYIKMNIYSGDMPVDTLHEEGWYKYVIGRYRTFDEANQLLKKVKIPKAFVVAYKNHKRVPIREASEK